MDYTPKQPFTTGLAHKGQAIVGSYFKLPKSLKTLLALSSYRAEPHVAKDGDRTIKLEPPTRQGLKQLMIKVCAQEKLDRLTQAKRRETGGEA